MTGKFFILHFRSPFFYFLFIALCHGSLFPLTTLFRFPISHSLSFLFIFVFVFLLFFCTASQASNQLSKPQFIALSPLTFIALIQLSQTSSQPSQASDWHSQASHQPFWAAAPKGTKSCRTQGDFRSSCLKMWMRCYRGLTEGLQEPKLRSKKADVRPENANRKLERAELRLERSDLRLERAGLRLERSEH